MQRRFSAGVLVATALLALTLGTFAGGIAGGITAYVVKSGESPSPTATGQVAEPIKAQASTTATATATAGATGAATTGPAADSGSIADVVQRVGPAVVTVINKQALPGGLFGGGGETEPAGTGTGFIIDDQGHVVTNNHVVEGSQELQVIFADGKEASAKLLGADQFADLAVIKIAGPVPGTLTFGDSDRLRPGDRVIAIGSALGDFTNTVTDGIVSALNRSLQTPEGYNMEGMIQHDAPINPGNSGGPLLNLRGEVVGVNTAVVRQAEPGVTAEGLGFAIPSKTVSAIVQQLITKGKVERPYIGIEYEPVTPGSARASDLPVDHGVLVQKVQPGSPAEAAGIEPNDVITKLNGQTIDSDHPLVNQLFTLKSGDQVEVELYRARTKQTLTLKVTLGSRPDNT